MPKGTSWMSNNENIKPVALAVIELLYACLSIQVVKIHYNSNHFEVFLWPLRKHFWAWLLSLHSPLKLKHCCYCYTEMKYEANSLDDNMAQGKVECCITNTDQMLSIFT